MSLAPPSRHRVFFRIPIALILGVGLSGLTLIAAVSVMWVSLGIAQQNTVDLLQDKARNLINTIESRVRAQLEPAEDQVTALAFLWSQENETFDDLSRLERDLKRSMVALPQVNGTAISFADGRLLLVSRDGSVERSALSSDNAMKAALELARNETKASWGPPIWQPELQQTIVNVRYPLRHRGKFIGFIGTAVSTESLSQFLQGLDVKGWTPFILYDRDYVLATPYFDPSIMQLDRSNPLPRLNIGIDPILANIWTPDRSTISTINLGPRGEASEVKTPKGSTIFLWRELNGFGDKPWVIGTYIDSALASPEVARLEIALGLGLAIVLVAVAAGLWVARLIGRPVRELAKAAESVRDLDFDAIGPAGRSRIRELDDASDAFNQMLAGLRWFETYVPQTLVRRLLTLGDRTQVPSEGRIVTVLFTDIQGFTALSERLGATETAALLNHHFTIVNTAVDEEQGTVDKYIGDSVMAYWGAPVAQPDHAVRACRAVRAIANAVAADNVERVARGEAPLNMRIGLHTGLVIAGNIGSSGRINYTVVGDTVNTANRLEQLGKELFSDLEVCTLVSAATVEAAGKGFNFVPAGQHQLRGREGILTVYRLIN